LTDVLIGPRLALAAEQPESLPPARVPCQIALHVKLLCIDEAKLAEARTELGDLIDENGSHSANEKPPAPTCRIKILDEGESPKKLERLRERGVGKVIAEPTIVTLDGRETTVHSGSEVPILEVDQTVNGEKRTSIRHQPVGHTLNVVPKLTGPKTIHLELSHEVNWMSRMGKEKQEPWRPKLVSQKIETSMKLRPGQTVLLVNRQSIENGGTEIEPAILLVAVTPELVSPLDAADIPTPSSKASADGKPVSNGGGRENVLQMAETSTRGERPNPLLADEIRNLETKKNLLLEHYGSNHPKVMSLQSQLDLLRRRQADKLLAAMEREIRSETIEADALSQPKPAKRRVRSSQEPWPKSLDPGERQVQRVDNGSILSELRSLREDVRAVRSDVNRLIELLENRRGSQTRSKQEGSSEPTSDTVTRDFPGGTWDLTLREAITIALQNSKTVRVASAESTTGGPIRIRRSNADMSLADVKEAAANLVTDVERTYWDLWRGYRNLDTAKAGRDASQESWRDIHAQKVESDAPAVLEQAAREQYFLFRDKMSDAIRAIYAGEQRLRFLLGLPGEDGRLIRPSEDPTVTKTSFDWHEIRAEALENRTELSRQRWKLRQRETELVAAKAQLQPSQESAPPIGYRTSMAGIRNAQMVLAREKAALEDIELNAVHQLTGAVRNLDEAYVLAQTHSNRWKATEQEVEALTERHSPLATPDVLADAHNRRAATAIDYWKSLADFANALSDVHLKKGSLLRYRNIVVDDYSAAEGEEENRDASK